MERGAARPSASSPGSKKPKLRRKTELSLSKKSGGSVPDPEEEQAGAILVNMGATWAFEFSANFTNIHSVISFDETKIWTQSNHRTSICSIEHQRFLDLGSENQVPAAGPVFGCFALLRFYRRCYVGRSLNSILHIDVIRLPIPRNNIRGLSRPDLTLGLRSHI